MQQRFRERVLERIQAMKITKAELARRMEVAAPYVSNYLAARFSPGLDVIEKFARALEVDPSQLVDSKSLDVPTTSRRRPAKVR